MTKTDNFNPVSTIIVSKSLNAFVQELNKSGINFNRLDNCSTNPRNLINSDLFPSEPDLSQFFDCFSVYGDESDLSKFLAYNDCSTCYFRLTSDSSPTNFDWGEEPDLSKFLGYDDCSTCYFRLSTIKRITQNVKTLRGG